MTNTPAEPGQFPGINPDTRAREEYILGQPPRLPSLTPDERSERQQQLLESFSTIVVDGELRQRADKDSIEIMLRHPELYEAHINVAQKFLSDGEMTSRDRELAVLRIAWLSQAPFEWGAHVDIAKRVGMNTREIEWLIEGSLAPGWNKHDRAIVRAAEELHFDSMIADETWAALEEFFNDKQLIELVILAGQYKTVAYYQHCLRFRLPESNKGLAAR